MLNSDLVALAFAASDARDAADMADAAPRDVSLAFDAFALAQMAFELAVALGSSEDMAFAMDADYREAILGGLGGSC